MYVWRIETRTGKGAYRVERDYSDTDSWPSHFRYNVPYEDRGTKRDPHPAPSEDKLDYMTDAEFCGFESAEALIAWFFRDSFDGHRLADYGLLVTIWKVKKKHIRKGRRQLVFIRDKAERVFTQSPLEFEGTLT